MGLLSEMSVTGSNEVAAINKRSQIIEHVGAAFDTNENLRIYEDLMKMLESGDEKLAYRAALTGLMIERVDGFMKNMADMYGESVVTANLNALPKRVLDVVRIFYPNQIAQDLVDIQPIDGEVGQIFTMTPQFTSAIAGVSAGGNVFTTQPTLDNYASETFSETVGTGDGSTVTFTHTMSLIPVRPSSITINATVASSAVVLTDNGLGGFNVNASLTSGSINYTTGVISLTFASAATTSTAITATYDYDSETSYNNIRQIQFNIGLQPVQAKIHPLQFNYSVRAGLAAQAHLAVDVQDTLANIGAQYIKIERDNKLVNLIVSNATHYSALDFNASTSGLTYDKRAFYGELELKMNYAESQIQVANGRGGVDFMLCGTNVADVIRNARGFKPAAVVAPIGAHVIGYLRDGTVTVVKSLFMDANTYVFGYKGYMAGDSATILAEWIPIYFTPTFQSPQLNNQQGMMSMYDLFVNRASYYVYGVMTNYAS